MPAQKRKAVKKAVSRKQPKELKVASQNQRFGHHLLDMLFYFVLVALVGFVLGLLGLGSIISQGYRYVLSFSIMFIYYSASEAFFGRTLGKLFTKTKVVSEDGSPLKIGSALLRTSCRFIPFDGISFMVKPVGWHDKISKTRVVPVK
jgi:uncharacterized RDD family membrane protein YckC